ncbi:type III secretion system inner membrane ring lipoprotein SctJ [Sphingobium sp. C100]|jgi:type III secretion protein J|uniref:type III secretion system inner membrane ring lipoprotein SctJ n=1 Tax=Sphingobium sp. C100 TaxID=1207055 RepID=UPI000409CC9C|nr:type III secretion inner membrane ring lipoprotein SctJ [Sphingobium sp. C100]
MKILGKSSLALLAALALAGCGSQEIYGQLKEDQANDMIAALRDAHIDAAKSSDKDGQWAVSVGTDDFSKAIQLLRAKGLPREDFANLGSLFEKKGLVSSPTEERARLIYGLSQELSHTVSEIDGVVQARVHLAMPEADPLSDKVKPASAAIFVKYQPGYDLRSQTGAIKSLVTNSIEGLAYDKVSVVMVPSQAAPPPEQSMLVASFDNWASRILLALVGTGGLAALFWRRRRPVAVPVKVEGEQA